MGTPIQKVFDLFMQTVDDYKLTSLLDTSEEDFTKSLEGWLSFSIVEFKNCNQSLNYDEYTQEFDEDLTLKNKVVLATLMTKYWFQKSVNDTKQFKLHINDRDFKVSSEAQNLKEKKEYLIVIKEDCSQMLNDYSYTDNNWDAWFNQQFGG